MFVARKNTQKLRCIFVRIFLGHPLDYIHIIMCYISYREHYLLYIIYTTLCVTYSHKQHYVRCIFVRFFGATLYIIREILYVMYHVVCVDVIQYKTNLGQVKLV